MGLEEIKKQVLMLHQAVMTLDFQDQLEAVDFIINCFEDLRLKSLSYEDLSGEVLNLSTIKKNSFEPEPEDHFVNFRFPNFYDGHNFDDVGNDFSGFEYDHTESLVTLDRYDRPIHHIVQEEISHEMSSPVNLVMPAKKERTPSPSIKKSRRKQMFTRKSVRRCAGKTDVSSPKDVPAGLLCIGCSDTFPNTSQLHSHMKSHDPVSLSCRNCRSTFNSIVQFSKHKDEKKCRRKVDFVCSDCGVKFKFSSHYLKHLRGHQENNCKYCSEKFSSGAQFREHVKKSHQDVKLDKDSIPCKFCPMSFPRLHRLYSHYSLHHSKGKFVCLICGTFLSTKEKYKEHSTIHENEKNWQCTHCNKRFFSRRVLTKHNKIHESGQYKCLTCKVSVTSQVDLSAHKRDKHVVVGLEPTLKCDTCDKQFRKKSSLQRHLLTHSDAKPFDCADCMKAFSTLECLIKHQKLKTHFRKAKAVAPESKYEKVYEDQLVCEHCGKQYKTFALLRRHIQTHTDIFTCQECGKGFSVKINLLRHMKNHGNKKMAVCELCGDSFSTMWGLKEHTAVKHDASRPVKCDICAKSFKRNSELNRHKRVHDKERPYSCYCGRNYKQIAHLRSHQKSVHSKDIETEHERNDMSKRDRNKEFLPDGGNLLSLDHFEGHDYRLHDSFKVPYVPDDYNQHMNYISTSDLQFGAPPPVSPAVDLSMVTITDVDCGLVKVEAKDDNLPLEPNPPMPLVDLSEHIVQEYLLNLP